MFNNEKPPTSVSDVIGMYMTEFKADPARSLHRKSAQRPEIKSYFKYLLCVLSHKTPAAVAAFHKVEK